MKAKGLLVLILLIGATSVCAAENKPFGVGVIVGDPTGITVKYHLDPDSAIAAGIGWETSDNDRTYGYADYLYHLHDLIKVKKGRLPVYFGCGLRFLERENKDDKFGLRLPVGLEYRFDGLPLGAFAEAVPVLNLSPDTDLDMEGGLGIRFFF